MVIVAVNDGGGGDDYDDDGGDGDVDGANDFFGAKPANHDR